MGETQVWKNYKKAYLKDLRQWLVVIYAAFVIVAAVWGYSNYSNLMASMDQYSACQTAGNDMKEASDYLTNQARYFAALGDPVYMENYFTEANETRRRDEALETLGVYFEGTEAFNDLQQSYAESKQLMNTEYYSMRLVCEAIGLDEDKWPEEIRDIEVLSADSGLSAEGKQDRALDILLDSNYRDLKSSIDDNAKKCTNELLAQTKELSDHYKMLFRRMYLVMVLSLLAITILAIFLLEARNRLQAYQKDLETAMEAAQSANAAKSRFLFNISHDIRTPMNAILGFSELLEKHRYDDAQFKHNLDAIKNSGAYLLDIINNVLDMARIENGKLVPEERVVPPVGINERIEAVFGSEFAAKKLDYRFECGENMKATYNDPALVSKIILNIVGNAVKYTPEGGSITFKIDQVMTEPGYCNVNITVSDTGVGMSEEFLEHAFDAFERERNSTESGVGGTGLGLGIVKGIVDCLNGEISIESQVGVGTTVRVTLPQRLAEEVAIGDQTGTTAEKADDSDFTSAVSDTGEVILETVPQEPDLTGKHILLVEDNDLNAEIAIELIEDTGASVDRAENGAACLDMLENAEPGYYQLIFMDIQMPVMNGYEATGKIRSLVDTAKAGIPIYAMSANAFEEDIKNSLAAGMNGHLAKPIDTDRLMDVLRTIQ